jgi:hypothetical protein
MPIVEAVNLGFFLNCTLAELTDPPGRAAGAKKPPCGGFFMWRKGTPCV